MCLNHFHFSCSEKQLFSKDRDWNMSAVKTEASADGGSVVNGAGPVYENKEDSDNVR